MAEKDLIKLKKRADCTPEELIRQEKIWKRLKGTSSNKRKIAQKISGLKRANPENIEKKLLALITDPSISALEIMKMIEFVKTDKDMRTETFIQLINSTIKAHSTIFGNKNLNVNIDVNQEELNNKVYELIGNVREESVIEESNPHKRTNNKDKESN